MSNKSVFDQHLKKTNPKNDKEREWIFLFHDQLNDQFQWLKDRKPVEIGIVLIESRWWARRRPYHKMKLGIVWGNQRTFALEQSARGVQIDYRPSRKSFRDALSTIAKEKGTLHILQPAEYEIRQDIAPLIEDQILTQHDHDGWLTDQQLLHDSQWKDGTYKMDSFYRLVRKKYNILMDGDDYEGGKLSFDHENREKWTKGKDSDPPALPRYKLDEIAEEVCQMIERDYDDHPGTLDLESSPLKLKDVQEYWKFFLNEMLGNFGTYEDAMSHHSSVLFHSKISTLLNIHRLMPKQLIEDVEKSSASLNSKEGFIRQVIGWREFMNHLHVVTNGFRELPEHSKVTLQKNPGSGGYKQWQGKNWESSESQPGLDGGAQPAYLDSNEPVPPAYWGKQSGMNCLDSVVSSVWEEGWSHHITRLMILSNIATLLDISSRDLTDWFWVAYSDAWDWVVEPNVLAMGTYSIGPFMTTKPYIAGSAYINKMSDYCENCAFHPKKDCPITNLYWAFLARHEEKLSDNPRLRMPYNSLKKRSAQKRNEDQDIFEHVSKTLRAGKNLHDQDLFE